MQPKAFSRAPRRAAFSRRANIPGSPCQKLSATVIVVISSQLAWWFILGLRPSDTIRVKKGLLIFILLQLGVVIIMTQYFSVTTSRILRHISLLKKRTLSVEEVTELQNPDQTLTNLPSLPKLSVPNLTANGNKKKEAPQRRLRPDATAEEIMADVRSRRIAEKRENQWLGVKAQVTEWFSRTFGSFEPKPAGIEPKKKKKDESALGFEKAKNELDGLVDDLMSDQSRKPPPKN